MICRLLRFILHLPTMYSHWVDFANVVANLLPNPSGLSGKRSASQDSLCIVAGTWGGAAERHSSTAGPAGETLNTETPKFGCGQVQRLARTASGQRSDLHHATGNHLDRQLMPRQQSHA
jgi:hypothetical protein